MAPDAASRELAAGESEEEGGGCTWGGLLGWRGGGRERLMRVSVFLPERDRWESLVELALAAEAAGVDEVLLPDHLAFGAPQLEVWTAMSALAARTERVGLGFGVLSATFRPPGLLAKMVDALDQIAGGRVTIGLGAGVDAAEHERYGLAFPPPGRRLALLEECCEALRRLCARPPRLVIGASGDRALEVVARQADEWNCGAVYLDRAAERMARLDRLADRLAPRRIARSVNVGLRVGPVPETAMARTYNLHLGLHGGAAEMVARAAELRRLGFDGIWLMVADRAAFGRALALVAELRAL